MNTALIDSNNFYAACEQSLDPKLVGQPLVVLSNNDGCVIARSAEARKLGIRMGKPYFQIHHELTKLGVKIRSSNYALYGDMSRRLMSLLAEHCENLNVYSIDEAFTESRHYSSQELQTWAYQLRATVCRNLGLTISIGVGANKTQAKLANQIAKAEPIHAGIFDLTTTNESDLWLESIPIEDVWGIGRKLAHWCRLKGIKTARQLRDMPSNELHAKCGVKGIRLQRELNGHPSPTFSKTEKQETRISRSFKEPITNLEELKKAISNYVVRASEKLRQQKQKAGKVTVYTSTSLFISNPYNKSATASLALPSNHTGELLSIALQLTEKIFHPHYPLKKAGVLMQELHNENNIQQNLFMHIPLHKQHQKENLMQSIDQLNNRFGAGTIQWAACGSQRSWTLRHNHISRAATTRLKEIPIVKA